jgi:cytosine/adenosine deaminase-related metal-dependent hydrolase
MATEGEWLLTGARVALGARSARELDVYIRAGRIHAIAPGGKLNPRCARVELRGCMLLPGLINAHEHLELNLLPRLGQGPYPSANAWARDIYHPERSPLREHLQLPMEVRLRWGGIKNLISGVTTVSNHNPYDAEIFEDGFPVRVQRELGWAHSLEFSPNLPALHRQTPPGWPFIVHLAESTGRDGALEIFKLQAMGALDGRTVIVHGVGLNGSGLNLVKRSGASLVWCPSSNLFVLGKTLGAQALQSGIPIALGTDSAISGDGDMLDEIKAAAKVGKAPPGRIYEMVTTESARVLRLTAGEGAVAEGSSADLVLVRDTGGPPARTLLRLQRSAIEAVWVAGRVHLASRRMAPLLPRRAIRGLQMISVDGDNPRLVRSDVRRLVRLTSRILGARILLAGKRIECL